MIVELTVPAGVSVSGAAAVLFLVATLLSMSTKKLTAVVALLVAPWKRTQLYDRVMEILKIVHNVPAAKDAADKDSEP